MNESEMRRSVLDLILWAEPEKIKVIWSFVKSYLSDETVGIHDDEDYLIEYGKSLQAKRRRKEARP